MLKVIQTRPKLLESPLLILDLRTLLLALHHQASRNMRQTNSRISSIHPLPSRTRRAEQIQTNIIPLQIHIELTSFRENSHRSSGSLNSALSLSLRHPLNAVHPRFIFHDAIDPISRRRQLEDNALESTCSTRILVIHFQLPTTSLSKLGIHTEQIASKNSSFVTTRTATNLDDGILAVVRVGRKQQYLNPLLHLRKLWLNLCDLLFRHIP